MTLDIKEGDILVVNGTDYNIRRAAQFEWRMGAVGSTFSKLASVDCSTKRQVVTTDATDSNLKKRSAAHVANLSGLKCLPLDSVRAKLAESEGFGRTHTLMETMITDATHYVHLWVEREL